MRTCGGGDGSFVGVRRTKRNLLEGYRWRREGDKLVAGIPGDDLRLAALQGDLELGRSQREINRRAGRQGGASVRALILARTVELVRQYPDWSGTRLFRAWRDGRHYSVVDPVTGEAGTVYREGNTLVEVLDDRERRLAMRSYTRYVAMARRIHKLTQ